MQSEGLEAVQLRTGKVSVSGRKRVIFLLTGIDTPKNGLILK
jgi:hypothetical protein